MTGYRGLMFMNCSTLIMPSPPCEKLHNQGRRDNLGNLRSPLLRSRGLISPLVKVGQFLLIVSGSV